MAPVKNLVYLSALAVAVNGWSLEWESSTGEVSTEIGENTRSCVPIDLAQGGEYAWDPNGTKYCLGLFADKECKKRNGFSCSAWGPRNTSQDVAGYRVFDTPDEVGGEPSFSTEPEEPTSTSEKEPAPTDEESTTSSDESTATTTADGDEPTETDTQTSVPSVSGRPTGIPSNSTTTSAGDEPSTSDGGADPTGSADPTDGSGDEPSGTGEEPPVNSEDAAGLSTTISSACVGAAVLAAFGFLA